MIGGRNSTETIAENVVTDSKSRKGAGGVNRPKDGTKDSTNSPIAPKTVKGR